MLKRRVEGSGRKAANPEIKEQLYKWILDFESAVYVLKEKWLRMKYYIVFKKVIIILLLINDLYLILLRTDFCWKQWMVGEIYE